VDLIGRTKGLIIDPFLGSGTTMIAAEQAGRICYGMELEPKYVAVTLERMSDMGLEPELVDNG
jgi:DNA modification methylase